MEPHSGQLMPVLVLASRRSPCADAVGARRRCVGCRPPCLGLRFGGGGLRAGAPVGRRSAARASGRCSRPATTPWDARVARQAGRLEVDAAELRDEVLERHAVLQRDRRQHGDGVHEAADGRAFLRDVDEDLAGRALVVQADGDVALLLADAELVRDRTGARPAGGGGRARRRDADRSTPAGQGARCRSSPPRMPIAISAATASACSGPRAVACESTWWSREPSRYTVMPLHPSRYASMYARSTSPTVASVRKLIVLLTALSV